MIDYVSASSPVIDLSAFVRWRNSVLDVFSLIQSAKRVRIRHVKMEVNALPMMTIVHPNDLSHVFVGWVLAEISM